MKNLGFSLNSHYRLIKTPKDIEKIISFFSKELGVKNADIGFYDNKTYEFYRKAYLASKAVKFLKMVNLHLPRKDWQIISLNKIIKDANFFKKNIGVKKFIIHYKEYDWYHEKLKPENMFWIENNEGRIDTKNYHRVKSWVCDVNHFLKDKKYGRRNLNLFIKNNTKKIKEIHFSNTNSPNLRDGDIKLMKELRKKFGKGVLLVYEGTDKGAKNFETLFKTLKINFSILKKIW